MDGGCGVLVVHRPLRLKSQQKNNMAVFKTPLHVCNTAVPQQIRKEREERGEFLSATVAGCNESELYP
jgi:hypothetical protein